MNRPCLAAGCPYLASKNGYCTGHSKPIEAERQAQRRIYSSPQHKTWRSIILARDPVCVECRQAPSVIADHRIAVKAGGDWSLSNGQGMCKPCHGRKSVRQDGALSHA